MAPSDVSPFRIAISDAALTDLRARIAQTRWPADAPGVPWELGTDAGFLKRLADYWLTTFDWRVQEERLNRLPQFTTEIDGVRIHFVHGRAKAGAGYPLLLCHGWPSAFIEYLPVGDLLAAEGFDVVVPSLPGYGFSARPTSLGVNYRHVARMWRTLMSRLGYERYGVGGGDFGAGVATLLALEEPRSVTGVHLTNFELLPDLSEAPEPPLSPEEAAFLADSSRWWEREAGYKQIQGTKPQTLSYALTDSPVGLASWILEKWRAWTDSHGDLEEKFGPDFLLTLVTLYWVTGTPATSIRDYYDNRWYPSRPGPGERIDTPTAFAVFSHYFGGEPTPPRSLVERLYNVTRWTAMARGGHFAPLEEPRLVADDIRAFFETLR
jgi:pimeloyl-ACP methyl ester carboxylesterase